MRGLLVSSWMSCGWTQREFASGCDETTCWICGREAWTGLCYMGEFARLLMVIIGVFGGLKGVLLESYVVVAVVLLTKTISKWRNDINVTKSDVLGLMACDGVGVQWQNGDLCGASLVLAVLCGTPPPFLAALQSSSLLLCLYVNLRILPRIYLHDHFLHLSARLVNTIQ